ncbi:MAG: hypothetical protein ACRCVI_02025 [Mycoplasmoidaceae bacterium]
MKNKVLIYFAYIFPWLLFFNKIESRNDETQLIYECLYKRKYYLSFTIVKAVEMFFWIVWMTIGWVFYFYLKDNPPTGQITPEENYPYFLFLILNLGLYFIIFALWIAGLTLYSINVSLIRKLKKEHSYKIMPSVIVLTMTLFIGPITYLAFRDWSKKEKLNQ